MLSDGNQLKNYMFDADKDEDPLAVTFTLNYNYINKKYKINLNLEEYSVQTKICMTYLRNALGNHIKYLIIAEPTLVGNWHAHGIIKKASFYSYNIYTRIKRTIGNLLIKPITDLVKWKKYITKGTCTDFIYNDIFIKSDKIPTVQFKRILHKYSEYFKDEDIKFKFSEEDFQSYKYNKALNHMKAFTKMFRVKKKPKITII